MSDETSDNKEHEPSQRKLDDARRKGEVARSTDLITAAAYGGFLTALIVCGGWTVVRVGAELRVFFDQADQLADLAPGDGLRPVLGGIGGTVILALGPWFALPAAFAILSVAAQRAFVVAPSKLAPKFNRISPLAGLRNKFGRQGLFEFGKSFLKLLLYCVVLGLYLQSERDHVLASVASEPAMIALALGRMTIKLLAIVLCISAALGVVDFLFQRAEHLRKNRMTRKELMDEMKNAEGDPVMKQRRRQQGMDIATHQMLADVPQASVVIVNPTHYAVALQWDGRRGRAPVCVAKGVDEIAARIRAIALEHGVPIHADPPTARALHGTVGIGDEIAPAHFQAVATAIRFAQKMRKQAGRIG